MNDDGIDLDGLKNNNPKSIQKAFSFLVRLLSTDRRLSVDDCKDVANTALANKMQHIHRVATAGEIVKHARDLAKTLRRSRARKREDTLDDSVTDGPGGASKVLDAWTMVDWNYAAGKQNIEDRLLAALAAINRLPSEQKKLFLRWVKFRMTNPEGTQAQFAQIEGVTPGVMAVRIKRIRDTIADLM